MQWWSYCHVWPLCGQYRPASGQMTTEMTSSCPPQWLLSEKALFWPSLRGLWLWPMTIGNVVCVMTLIVGWLMMCVNVPASWPAHQPAATSAWPAPIVALLANDRGQCVLLCDQYYWRNHQWLCQWPAILSVLKALWPGQWLTANGRNGYCDHGIYCGYCVCVWLSSQLVMACVTIRQSAVM